MVHQDIIRYIHIYITSYRVIVIRYIDCCEVQKKPTCLIYFTGLYPRTLTSPYPQVCIYLLVSSDPYILVCPDCIPASSYPQIRVCLLVSLHHHILRLISARLYTRIFESSYPQIHVCFLVSLHPHILISPGSCVLVGILAPSHPPVLRFMCACLYPHILRSICSRKK